MKTAVYLIILVGLAIAPSASAQTPRVLNVQGVLAQTGGDALPDGTYPVAFRLFGVADGGTPLYETVASVDQQDGVFSVVLGALSPLDPAIFDSDLYLAMQMEGDTEMTPRIRLASAPYAFRSATVDAGAVGPAEIANGTVVRSVNGLSDNVTLVGGENVTVTSGDSTLTISATGAGASGWVVSGDDLFHYDGTVYIQPSGRGEPAPERDGETRDPNSAKLRIVGENEGVYATMEETDDVADSRAAVFGRRSRVGTPRPGNDLTVQGSNAGVTGYNLWGDTYTFGVSGFTWFDYPHTAGVFGASNDALTWSALAYLDDQLSAWGLYTPNPAHIGGVAEVGALRLETGAQAGYVLTSDAAGNASWQTPAGGGGGDDGDWVIAGDDLHHNGGTVYIDPAGRGPVPRREGDTRLPTSSKLSVSGDNEGVYSIMTEVDDLADGRAAIYGRRTRAYDEPHPGSGFSPATSNAAVSGYNDWGDSFTFGVSGYTWFDSPNTGGVIAADNAATVWSALAYADAAMNTWGLYTPNPAHIGGLAEVGELRLGSGAQPGYILTSDAVGNATWQPPSTASSDGDWEISGDDLVHASEGTVTLGTDTPAGFLGATLQVRSVWPAIALDAEASGFKRWVMYADSYSDELVFAHNTSTSGAYPAMRLEDNVVHVTNPSGQTRIRMVGEAAMETGGSIQLYDDNTQSRLSLRGRAGVNGGGSISVRNDAGTETVYIVGDHDGTGVGRVQTQVLEITGGADLSEQFDVKDRGSSVEPGMVVSIDPERPGHLTLSDHAFDRRVAGVISGAGGVNTGMLMGQRRSEADGELPVALAGRVYVRADASAGPISPGDLLTTADRPGHAMRVDDPSLASGAILGKAMTGLTSGQGLVLVLVSLQ